MHQIIVHKYTDANETHKYCIRRLDKQTCSEDISLTNLKCCILKKLINIKKQQQMVLIQKVVC